MKKAMAETAGSDRRVSFALRDCSLGVALIGAASEGFARKRELLARQAAA